MIAYFDCFSGISGDMTLGAMIDLGVDRGWLEDHLKSSLGITGFELALSVVRRCGISAKKVDVIVTDTEERDYARIRRIIEKSTLSDCAARKSLDMFQKIAAAEAAIHNCPEDDVHFHELGGVDAIVDIVGTAVCMEHLGIDTVVSSKIALGSGMVSCAHGRLPVPAPATLSILSGVPAYGTDIDFELTTPTGAAIITAFAKSFEPLPDMVVKGAGYGAGGRDFSNHPNILRVIAGHHPGRASGHFGHVEVIETCIDDMNPEVFGYVTDRLFQAGALDVCLIPAYMKKGRPGTLLQILCPKACLDAVSTMVLTETSAIGLRHYGVSRRVLERSAVFVVTPYGRVSAKKVMTPAGGFRIAPEFEDCRNIAQSMDIPIREVYEAAIKSGAEKGNVEEAPQTKQDLDM